MNRNAAKLILLSFYNSGFTC